MSGKIDCKCGKQYSWKPQLAGKRARCKCGNIISFPLDDPAAMEIPEGFEGMEDLAGDVPPPPPPPPPVPYRGSGSTAVATPSAVKRGRRIQWNWKTIRTILIGLGCIGVGVYFFLHLQSAESSGEGVRFTGRRAGLLNLAYSIGGKWAVLALFILGGAVTGGWGVWNSYGDDSDGSDGGSGDAGGDGDFGGGDD